MEDSVIADEAFIMWINGQLKAMSDFDSSLPRFTDKNDARYKKLTAALDVYVEYVKIRHVIEASRSCEVPALTVDVDFERAARDARRRYRSG